MALDKFEFINNLIAKFSHYIQGEQAQKVSYDAYSRVLTKKIDYEKLWDLVCNEYAFKTPPTGVELKGLAKKCILEDFKNEASKWQHVTVYDPILKVKKSTDCFPIGTPIDKMLATYEKRYKVKGWQILEVE